MLRFASRRSSTRICTFAETVPVSSMRQFRVPRSHVPINQLNGSVTFDSTGQRVSSPKKITWDGLDDAPGSRSATQRFPTGAVERK